MPNACIDVGSNTTRLLVAEIEDGGLRPVVARRAFTQIGASAAEGGAIPAWKVHEVAEVVAGYCRLARQRGCAEIVVVATAAVRDAPNRAALVHAVEVRAAVPVRVLSCQEEARLAFAGATSTSSRDDEAELVVVDVGGGSTEVVCGKVTSGVSWSASFPIGSGLLTQRHLRCDPPTEAELRWVRRQVEAAFKGLAPPRAERALAVGGSATSLERLVGEALTPKSLGRAIHLLAAMPARAVADRFGLAPERVRLLPAGVLVLAELSRRLGLPLARGGGGLREGTLLDLASVLGSKDLGKAS